MDRLRSYSSRARNGCILAAAVLVCCIVLAACAQPTTTGSTTTAATASSYATVKIDVNAENTTSAPALQNDFYLGTNYDWISSTTIDPTKRTASAFDDLEATVNNRLVELSSMSEDALGSVPSTSSEARVGALYSTALDMDTRNSEGLGDAQALVDSFTNATTLGQFEEALGAMSKAYDWQGVLGVSYTEDPKRRGVYTPCISEPSTIIEASYFSSDNPAVRDQLKAYIVKLLTLYGYSSDKARKDGTNVFDMMSRFAGAALAPEDYNDPSIVANLLSREDIKALYSNVDVDALMGAAGITPDTGSDTFEVYALDEAKVVNDCFVADNLDTLKAYMIVFLLDGKTASSDSTGPALARYLGTDMRDAYYSFHDALDGISQRAADEVLAASDCNIVLTNDYGQLYVAHYVGDSTKDDVKAMVSEIIGRYRTMIQASSWMEESTKAAAIAKIDSMGVRAVSPDTWPTYFDNLELTSAGEGGVYVNNVLKAVSARARYFFGLMNQPVDSGEWEYSTQEVNAFYDPSENTVTILAGILQAPFYDVSASSDANLGGIGIAIAHEITHAFDDSGSEYDSSGDLNNWWTDADRTKYEDLSTSIVSYYSRYEVLDGIFSNGGQTLAENIADLGAGQCVSAIEAQQHGASVTAGGIVDTSQLTDADAASYKQALKTMFSAFAACWKTKYTEAYLDKALTTDTHSIAPLRVDGVLSSTDAFYYAYDVKEGDGMYVAPEMRVGIW